jgi:sarcosine oxidase/L-pipecolate oxidase
MAMSDSSLSPTSEYPLSSGLRFLCSASKLHDASHSTHGRHGVIKVCDEFPGFTRYTTHQPHGAKSPQRISVPRSHAKHPTDTIPLASEKTLGHAFDTYLPRFADKPRFNKALCWCTDTADSNLLVCEYPGWKGFYIASGDSG